MVAPFLFVLLSIREGAPVFATARIDGCATQRVFRWVEPAL